MDETSYENFEPFIYFGDGAEKMSNQWGNRNATFDSSIQLSAKGQVTLAYEKFNQNEFEDVAYFTPLYLKEFVTGGGN